MKIGICLFTVVSVAALMALLNVGYRQGFLTSKRIAAALFIFRRSGFLLRFAQAHGQISGKPLLSVSFPWRSV